MDFRPEYDITKSSRRFIETTPRERILDVVKYIFHLGNNEFMRNF